MTDYEIVIPTSGRASLGALLDAIGRDGVIVVEDRERRGPAAARNRGWRQASAEWIVFLDDDVLPPPGWRARLEADLAAAGDAAGSQGRIVVPVPERPTDWERNVAGLERARWATADMAYRRDVLTAVGGFDERFPRAYREDADLGLRVTAAGHRIVRGERHVLHPVGPAPAWISLAKQAGNADDVLMRRLHGRGWRERAGVPRGRRPRHLAIAAAGRRRPRRRARPRIRLLLGVGWAAGTIELAWARIAPGPRTAARDRDDGLDERGDAIRRHRVVAARPGRAAAAAPAGGGALRPRRHADRRRPLQRRPGAASSRCRARSRP